MLPAVLASLDGAFVEVRTTNNTKTACADSAFQNVKTKSIQLEQHLRACIELLENAPSLIAIWKIKPTTKKLEKTVAALKRERQDLPRILGEVIDFAQGRSSEIDLLKSRLAESEKALRASQTAEAVSKRAEATSAARIAELERKVQELQSERAGYLDTIEQLTRTKESTYTRFKELTSEYEGIAVKAEQEIHRLEGQLVKTEDARTAAMTALNEANEKMRGLQRRYDSVKGLVDASKDAAAAAKKQAEEAAMQNARAIEAQSKRLADAKTARDAALAELDALRREHTQLHEAFISAGGLEAQVAVVRKAAAVSLLSQTGPAKGALVTRSVLRARHGWCVHARPCTAANDINKLSALPYKDGAGLEALVREQGLFLCSTCVSSGFFKAL